MVLAVASRAFKLVLGGFLGLRALVGSPAWVARFGIVRIVRGMHTWAGLQDFGLRGLACKASGFEGLCVAGFVCAVVGCSFGMICVELCHVRWGCTGVRRSLLGFGLRCAWIVQSRDVGCCGIWGVAGLGVLQDLWSCESRGFAQACALWLSRPRCFKLLLLCGV